MFLMPASAVANDLKPELANEILRLSGDEYKVTLLLPAKFRSLIKLGLVEKYPSKVMNTPFYRLTAKGISVKAFLLA